MPDNPLSTLGSWPARTVSGVVFRGEQTLDRFGDLDAAFALASVTKLLTAAACLVAAEEGSVTLDDPVGDQGATFADLLAHSSGMDPNTPRKSLATPRTRRIYANAGYEVAADIVETQSGLPFAAYLTEGVLSPVGATSTTLSGSPAHGCWSTANDLARVIRGLLHGRILAPETTLTMTTPWQPQLDGVLPGFGRQNPNLWGLGPEIRGQKHPHWTAPTNSSETWGHFGQAGSFIWADPVADLSVVVLTDEPFGPWAVASWPAVSTRILAAFT